MLRTASGAEIMGEIDDMPLSVQQATSIALVVNELVSNAVKYGKSRIEIAFRAAGDNAELVVTDDGPGFPAGFDYRTAANTGLMIVEQVVRHDLRAELIFDNRADGPGAEVTVVIPLGPA